VAESRHSHFFNGAESVNGVGKKFAPLFRKQSGFCQRNKTQRL
jgi:hypothetical protein